jgi:glycosyltransferase involved in cell wall biosynthesis
MTRMIQESPGLGGQTPLVSVIMGAFNASGFVGEACRSALRQSYTSLELIVVDDGSTDDTNAIVAELAAADPRVRLIHQQNLGVAAARNRAIAAASGEFIAPLDADDLWDRTKIERQVRRMLECGPDTGLVYCWWAWIDVKGIVLDRSPRWRIEGRVLQELAEVNFTGNASVPLYRRSIVGESGGYDEGLRKHNAQGCEDWDLVIRIAERYAVSLVPAVLVGYRRRTDSMSADCDGMGRSRDRVTDALAKRQPSLSPLLLRRSKGQFALHLAGVSFWAGNYLQAIRWALRVRPWTLGGAVAPHVARLLARRALGPRPPAVSLAGGDGRFEEANLPEPLIPYDRICARRWQAAVPQR